MHPLGKTVLASHAAMLSSLAVPMLRAPVLGIWGGLQAFFFWQLLRPAGSAFGPNISRAGSGGDAMAITFDDGPHPSATPRLLDRLEEHGIQATFFFVGRKAGKAAGIVRRVHDAGHTIGNHSYSHPIHWALAGPGRVDSEIGEAQKVLADITGAKPAFFRPPMGHKNMFLSEALEKHGLRQVTWSIWSLDTIIRDAEKVLRRVGPRTAGGEILLLHEGISLDGKGECLAESIIPRLAGMMNEKGIQPVSLRALLSSREEPRR